MKNITQEEYLNYAINWCNELGGMDIQSAQRMAILESPADVRWEIVDKYIHLDRKAMAEVIKKII